MTLIAQLSDPHVVAHGRLLLREFDTGAMLEAAVRRVAQLDPQPDLVVLSGDLVNRGRAEEYARLRELLAPLTMPWQLMVGNHDDRAALRAAFPEHHFALETLCCARRDLAGLELLFLDSIIPGEEGGLIAEAHLAWLDAAHRADRPALLFMHHPPFPTGIHGMDVIACRNAELLASWLERRPQVRAVICGHVHRTTFTSFAGRPAVTAPSVAHQIACDLTGTPNALAWCREPPGLMLHHWDGDRLVSHVLPVADYPPTRYG